MPSLAIAIQKLCTRGAPGKHKGCTSFRPVYTLGAAGVPPLYTVRGYKEEGSHLLIHRTDSEDAGNLPDTTTGLIIDGVGCVWLESGPWW
jgi:hypothetical protein